MVHFLFNTLSCGKNSGKCEKLLIFYIWYDIIKYRKLGPAIFKDMIEYIKFRAEISDDEADLILSEAISSYIVPQFEGLSKNRIESIRKLIDEIGLSQYLDNELEDLIPKF